jgi:hypothetical protein
VVNVDAALDQRFLDVAGGEVVAQVPRTNATASVRPTSAVVRAAATCRTIPARFVSASASSR